jgi:hypothetical protein
MGYLIVGIITLVAALGGLWFSLPVDGKIRPFAKSGGDTLIAIAVSVGIALGIGAVVVGITTIS